MSVGVWGASVSDRAVAVASRLRDSPAPISARTGASISSLAELARLTLKGCFRNGPKPMDGDALRQCMVL